MNPSFDKTASIEEFVVGGLNRLEQHRTDIGGKGINVARVLKKLGTDVQCLACLGDANKGYFLHLVEQEELKLHYLPVNGRIRTNLKILEKKTKSLTEINDNGPELTETERQEFLKLLVEKTAGSEYVVFSGSLPGGCDNKTYQEAIKSVEGRKCILDSSGESLLYGIQEKPYFIKPNLSELEGIMRSDLRTLRAIRDAALFLMSYGAQNVVVSMGKYGAVLVQPQSTLFAPAIPVDVHSTVGAGDCMIGGILCGLSKGASLPEAFRLGVAAGAASVMTEGTQPVRLEDYERLISKVSLQEV